jgi:phenylacetate-CoA ligase
VKLAAWLWAAVDAHSTFGALQLDRHSAERLARRRLSRLLVHAAAHNSFYRDRLRAVGIEAGDPVLTFDPDAALAALPPVSKPELRQAGASALDRGRIDPLWLSSSSSGPTGEPFRVYYEPRAWARLKYLVKLRARRACGVRLTDRIALLEAAPPRFRPFPGRWSRISVLQSPGAMVCALTSFSPDVLYGLPSALLESARMLQLMGERLRLRAIFTSGELFHAGVREALVNAYDAPVYHVYGGAETKEIAWECSDGGLHLNSDVVRLEALDYDGTPLPAGVEGELVATVLVNRALPLLRYRTGDRGWLRDQPCTCGRAAPLVGVVTGREAEVLVLRGGQRVSPYALTCALEQVSGVLRYQIIQLSPAKVRVRAMVDLSQDRERVAGEIRAALQRGVAPFLETEVEFVDCFPASSRATFQVVQALGAT